MVTYPSATLVGHSSGSLSLVDIARELPRRGTAIPLHLLYTIPGCKEADGDGRMLCIRISTRAGVDGLLHVYYDETPMDVAWHGEGITLTRKYPCS